MAGKRGDNHQVERVAAFGWIDVEFTGGPEPEVYVATIEKVGMPSTVQGKRGWGLSTSLMLCAIYRN